jgi:hypothetical protein
MLYLILAPIPEFNVNSIIMEKINNIMVFVIVIQNALRKELVRGKVSAKKFPS